jgi:hypothetical protein
MGIVVSQKYLKGRGKLKPLFFAGFFLLATLANVLSFNGGSVAAATFKPMSEASGFAWINDRTIRASGALTQTQTRLGYEVVNVSQIDFIDSNPNDTNRTFKAPGPVVNYCANDAADTIVLGSRPSSGTLYYIATPPPTGPEGLAVHNGNNPKLNCEVKSKAVSITALSSALIDSTDCSSAGGSTRNYAANKIRLTAT